MLSYKDRAFCASPKCTNECGQRTSKMTKSEMTELIELMMAFGAERGVKFADIAYD